MRQKQEAISASPKSEFSTLHLHPGLQTATWGPLHLEALSPVMTTKPSLAKARASLKGQMNMATSLRINNLKGIRASVRLCISWNFLSWCLPWWLLSYLPRTIHHKQRTFEDSPSTSLLNFVCPHTLSPIGWKSPQIRLAPSLGTGFLPTKDHHSKMFFSRCWLAIWDD